MNGLAMTQNVAKSGHCNKILMLRELVSNINNHQLGRYVDSVSLIHNKNFQFIDWIWAYTKSTESHFKYKWLYIIPKTWLIIINYNYNYKLWIIFYYSK